MTLIDEKFGSHEQGDGGSHDDDDDDDDVVVTGLSPARSNNRVWSDCRNTF